MDDIVVLRRSFVALQKDDEILRLGQDPLGGDGDTIAFTIRVTSITNSIAGAMKASMVTDTLAAASLTREMF